VHSDLIRDVFSTLRVRGAAQAIEFYTQVFGAVERFRLVEPSGRIGHAELQLGPSVLRLSEEFPEYGLFGPTGGKDGGAAIHLQVDNADAVAKRAVAAGAQMLSPCTDQVHGERSCRIRDPFGHIWTIGQALEALSAEEMQRRYTRSMSS
jgi:PhnB protein